MSLQQHAAFAMSSLGAQAVGQLLKRNTQRGELEITFAYFPGKASQRQTDTQTPKWDTPEKSALERCLVRSKPRSRWNSRRGLSGSGRKHVWPTRGGLCWPRRGTTALDGPARRTNLGQIAHDLI